VNLIPTLFVRNGRRLTQVTADQASVAMEQARDACGLGGSKTPNIKLYNIDGVQIGYVSYNGRVWLGSETSMRNVEIPTRGQKTAAQHEAEGWADPAAEIERMRACLNAIRVTATEHADKGIPMTPECVGIISKWANEGLKGFSK